MPFTPLSLNEPNLAVVGVVIVMYNAPLNAMPPTETFRNDRGYSN